MRETELKRVYWEDMIAQGCGVERFEGTYESAWLIIGGLETNATSTENVQGAEGVKKRAAEMAGQLGGDPKERSVLGWIRSILRLSRGTG